jgi:hypothetical protein
MIQLRRQWAGFAVLLVVVLFLSSLPAAPTQAQSDSIYFPQTGHYLGGAFRSFWERRGGLAIFGFPITAEFVQNSNGQVVQYFERARFELNVVNNTAVISLGLVGREYTTARGLGFPPVAPVPNSANVRYFPETSHTLRGEFKNFWERRGGVEIFGFPISEEITERLADGQNYTVQYFERARFELTSGGVRLALLGSELAPCQRRLGLPPNNPPTQPVPEGNPAECASIPNAVASGRVYPDVTPPGTVLGFEARNYLPGEFISMWLNLPDGTVRAIPYQAIAGNDGGVLIGFRTEAGDPVGQWSLVGQGTRSGRIVVAPFRLQR